MEHTDRADRADKRVYQNLQVNLTLNICIYTHGFHKEERRFVRFA